MKQFLLYIYGGYDADINLCIISAVDATHARTKLRSITLEDWKDLLSDASNRSYDDVDFIQYYENRMNYSLTHYPSF